MNTTPLARIAARFLCTTSLLLGVTVSTACDSETETEADDNAAETHHEDDADEDDGLAPDAVCEGAETEVDCGILLDSDGCGDDSLYDQTAADCSGNEAAAACVLAADTEGKSFTISQRYFRGGGQYDSGSTLHVDGDGAGSGSSGGVQDFCTNSDSFLFEGFDPSACSDAGCVMDAMDAISRTTYCNQQQTCEEGV